MGSCNYLELNQIEGIRERTKYFDKAQGGRASAIVWQGNLVWEDGSNRDLAEGGVGVMCDSSWIDKDNWTEVKENLSFQKIFAQEKLEDAVKCFTAAKDALSQQGNSALDSGRKPPENETLKEIKLLKEAVKKWTRKLDAILNKLHPVPKEYEYSQDEMERMEVNRSDAENFMEALSEIEI